jgi:transcriptional regulator with XRE-family HTH domain
MVSRRILTRCNQPAVEIVRCARTGFLRWQGVFWESRTSHRQRRQTSQRKDTTMLDERTVQWIQSLLAEGISQRSIAHITGVSRGRIGLIANRRRPDYAALRLARQQEQSRPFDPTKPAERCPDCGHLVHKPCMICRTRRAMALGPRSQRIPDHSRGFSRTTKLDLKEKHQARYEQVRLDRMRRIRHEGDS